MPRIQKWNGGCQSLWEGENEEFLIKGMKCQLSKMNTF